MTNEIKESTDKIETRYTFEDVKLSLREFVAFYRNLDFYTHFDFPNLFRISRRASNSIAGEFSPTYVKIPNREFRDLLLSFPKTKRYRAYFLGEVRLKKVE